jgi:hypothetical protein
MTDLHSLLEGAVDGPIATDVACDLRRGRRAAVRRRRRLLGGAAVLVLAGGAGAAASGGLVGSSIDAAHRPDGIRAGAFVLPPLPEGWAVQAADSSRVLVSPEGLPKKDFGDPGASIRIMGNLFVALRAHVPPRDSPTVRYHGRIFYDIESAPYPAQGYPKGTPPRQVAVRAPSGGWLWLQEAPRLGWSLEQMVEFLDGVVIGSDAVVAPD